MAKKEDKQNKTVRSAYYLHQITPILGYTLVLSLSLIGKSIIGEYYPVTSGKTLTTQKTALRNMHNTVLSLNNQKQSSLQEKQHLESVITDIRNRREADGSLRFYTMNLPAYGRYVEYRANANSIEIVDVDIHEDENTIDYTVLGNYNDLVAFFNTLETREIYYLEKFVLIPSLNNSGSYVKFTANFNLDATITQRYDRKSKYEAPVVEGSITSDTLNVVPEEDITHVVDTVDIESNAPDDTMNTGKQSSDYNPQTSLSSDAGGIVVEPLN